MIPELAFGQPVGSIIQYAYTVADMDAATARYTSTFGAGPWFLQGPFVPEKARYRGEPSTASLTLALTFAGRVQIELIQQHDEHPSVYRETIERQGYGFHHWGVATKDFDRDAERFSSLGYALAFADERPGGRRIAYFDTTRDLPGMVELIETTPASEQRLLTMYEASRDWDGLEARRMAPESR